MTFKLSSELVEAAKGSGDALWKMWLEIDNREQPQRLN